MQLQLISAADTAFALPAQLPDPPGSASARVAAELRLAHSIYISAYVALRAVDDPQSYHASLSADDKAKMRASRSKTLDAAQAAYQALLDRTYRNAAKRAEKSRKAALLAAPQQRLFADAWPVEFAEIAERFPRRPRVTNDLQYGTTVRPIDQAHAFSHIQHDPPAHCHLIVIDYDAPDGVTSAHDIWRLRNMPQPSWISSTPDSLRGHIVYALEKPVIKTSAARLKPLQYAAYVEAGLTLALSGDQGYARFLTKNPIHSKWDVDWGSQSKYSLKELARHLVDVDVKKVVETQPAAGLGRNISLFNSARAWAYRAVSDYWEVGYDNWQEAVMQQVEALNDFTDPLPHSEVKATAKSIAKWVWQRFTPLTKAALVAATHTPAVQAVRGRQKGAKTRQKLMGEALAMLEAGHSQTAVSAAIGVSQQTISNWVKRALEAAQPAGLN